MARGRRHGRIDPKATPAKATQENRRKRERRLDENTAIIRKAQKELASE